MRLKFITCCFNEYVQGFFGSFMSYHMGYVCSNVYMYILKLAFLTHIFADDVGKSHFFYRYNAI